MVKVDCMTPPIHTLIHTSVLYTHAPMAESSSSRPVCYDNKHLMSEDIKLQPVGALNILHAQAMDRSVINLVSFNQILFN